MSLAMYRCCYPCFYSLRSSYSGAYGTVYKAQDLKNEEIVAMKKVRIALTEDGVPMSVLRLDGIDN